ncbi:MAG: hypothetical protein Q7R57_09870, partial [Dehalococcoidales bacterium]|nr:hypothetical protein [Dehalococcoidales bacterium]
MRQPLIEEIRTSLTAPELFPNFQEHPFSFFLDSGMDPVRLGRYSFMGSDPFLVMRSRGREITLLRGESAENIQGNPFDVLREFLNTYSLHGEAPFPFIGGAVGYFSYDLCHFIERLPSTTVDDLKLPECYLALYDTILAYDHLEGKAYLVSTGFPELDEERGKQRAAERLKEVKSLIGRPRVTNAPPPLAGQGIVLKSNFSREEYLEAVAAAREYICAGDIFQV